MEHTRDAKKLLWRQRREHLNRERVQPLCFNRPRLRPAPNNGLVPGSGQRGSLNDLKHLRTTDEEPEHNQWTRGGAKAREQRT